MFENRSFDNLLGRLYEPGEVASFEGVIGKDLSNPVPDFAADRGDGSGVVPYCVAPTMNTPSPDPGEEYPHVNTQLFGIIDPAANRDVLAGKMVVPYNAPADPTQRPTMDGFVADYISSFTAEMGRARVRRVRADHDRLYARAGAGHLGTGPRVRRRSITGSARCRRRRSRTGRSFTRPPRLVSSTTCHRPIPSRCTTPPRRSSSGSTQPAWLAGVLRSAQPYVADRRYSRAAAVAALRHQVPDHRSVPAGLRRPGLCRPTRSSSPTCSTGTTTCTRRSMRCSRTRPSTPRPRCSAARPCSRRSTTPSGLPLGARLQRLEHAARRDLRRARRYL